MSAIYLFWDALTCVAWWKWECCSLSLARGRSNRDLLRLTVSWGSLFWTGLTWQAHHAGYWFLYVFEVDSFVLLSMRHIGQSFSETLALLSVLSWAKHVTGCGWLFTAVENPMDSYTLILIMSHKWKVLGWTWGMAAAGDVALFGQCVKWSLNPETSNHNRQWLEF